MVGRQPGVLPHALAAVGNTPLIRLNRIPQEEGIRCNVYAKCEFFNAGGSVKDRIAVKMLEEAEAKGVLTPGKSVIIEPTSGNTGVGLALACAIKGYRCIIVLPQKMSAEKVSTLKVLGAEVIRTPTQAAWDDPRSNIMVARRMATEIKDAHILDQYSNPNNPLAHRETAQEMIDDITAPQQAALLTPESSPRRNAANISSSSTAVNDHLSASLSSANLGHSGKVDVLVAGVGTGGTISGIATRLREADHNPDLYVVGVDPVGSSLAQAKNTNEDAQATHVAHGGYKVEGIGYDFEPDSLDKEQVSLWMKTEDDESFEHARKLIRKEGLLCGGSSGAAVSGAMRFLRQGGQGWDKFGSQSGKNVVVVLPDSVRNYITKDWLVSDAVQEQTIPWE